MTKTAPSSLRIGRDCTPGRTRRRKWMVQVHSRWHVETISGWDVHHVRPVSQPPPIPSTYTDIPHNMATNVRRKRDEILRRLCLRNGRSNRNLILVSSGVQKALLFTSTSVLFLFIDKTGRHPLFIYGAFGMGIYQFVVGGLMGKHGVIAPGGVENPPNAKAITQVEGAPAHSIIDFLHILIIHTLILAPVTWVYAVEAWSLETCATGMPFAAVSNWLSNWTLGCFVPPALRNIT